MIKLYKLIFYMLYKFFISIGRKDIPERKAIVVLSLWDCFYLLIPYGLVRYFVNRDLFIHKALAVSLIFSIGLIHFFSLVYNNKYLRIYRHFEKAPVFKDKYGVIILAAFLLFPVVTMVIFTFTIWK